MFHLKEHTQFIYGGNMKLTKQYYYNAKGERKINCYKVTITKDLAKSVGIEENDDIKIYAKDNKIVIEKAGK